MSDSDSDSESESTMRSMMGFSSFGTQRPAGTYLLPASRHLQCVRTERGRAVFMQNAFSFSLTSCVWGCCYLDFIQLVPPFSQRIAHSLDPVGSLSMGLEFEGEVFSVVEVDEKIVPCRPDNQPRCTVYW